MDEVGITRVSLTDSRGNDASGLKGLVENLADRVTPLEEDLEKRIAAAPKTYMASKPERPIYMLMPDGTFANISLKAPVAWGESYNVTYAELDADGKLWEVLWGGTCRIDNVENIQVGDYVVANGITYRVTTRPQKGYRDSDLSPYYYFEAGSVGFTGYPCGRTNEFVVVSAFDYHKSAKGRIGLVVRIPGLFCLNSTPYAREAGLWMKDADSFIVVGDSGVHEKIGDLSKVFHKDPVPIWESPYVSPSFPGGFDSPWFYRKSRAISWAAPNSLRDIEGQETYEVVEGTTVGFPMNEDSSAYALWPCTYRRRYLGDGAIEPCRYSPMSERTTQGIRYIELPIIKTGRDCVPFVGREYTLTVKHFIPDLFFNDDISDLHKIFQTYIDDLYGLSSLREAFIVGQEVKFVANNQEAGVSLLIVDKDLDFWERIHPAIDHVWMENGGQYPGDGIIAHAANVSAKVKYRGQILDGIVKLTLAYVNELVIVEPWNGRNRDRWSTTGSLSDCVSVVGSVNILSANYVDLSQIKDSTQALTSSTRVYPQPSTRYILPDTYAGDPAVLWEWMTELYNRTFPLPNGDTGRLQEYEIWALRPGDVFALRDGGGATRFVVAVPPHDNASFDGTGPWSPSNPREIVIIGTLYTDPGACNAVFNVEIGFGSEDGYEWFISYVFVPTNGIVRYNDGTDSPNWRWE